MKIINIVTALLLTAMGISASGCGKSSETDSHDSIPLGQADPLPGELAKMTLLEDSLRIKNMAIIKKEMLRVLTEYRSKFRQESYTGYFVTDIDHNDVPELWVKSGQLRDNATLELFYPTPDGKLIKSETPAEPGQYFVGDGYLIQMVSAGPGLININRITLRNNRMEIENIRTIDMYAQPGMKKPKFEEPEIKSLPFANLTALHKAFEEEER